MRTILLLLLLASPLAAETPKQRGLAAFAARNYTEAVPLLQTALRNDPADPQVRLALGVSLLMINNEPLAFPLLEPLAKERRPEGLQAALALASHLRGKGRHADSIPYLQEAWRLHPGRSEVFLPYAAALELLGRTNDLLRLLTDPAAPNDPSASTRRVELLVALGRNAEARSVAESPADPILRRELIALWLRRTGRTAEAADTYRALYETTRQPRYAADYGRTLLETTDRTTTGRLILDLVKPTAAALRVLRDIGLYETVVDHLLELERSTGSDQSSELIPLYEALSRWDDLLDRLVRRLLTADDLDAVRPRIMDLAFLRNRKDLVVERLETAAASADPRAAGRILTLLVELRLRTGERTAALKTALHHLDRTGSALPHARLLEQKGWTAETETLLDAVSRRASQPSERLEAALLLADLKTAHGRPAEALAVLDTIPPTTLPRTADTDRIHHSRGLALMAIGDFASAARNFATVQTKTAETLLPWAVCLHMTGQTAKALELVRQAGRDRNRAADAAYLEGVLLLASADRTRAEEAFRRAAQDPSPTASSLNALLELHILASAFPTTNRLGPYGRAVSLSAAGRYAEAAQLFLSLPGPLMRYRAAVSLGLAKNRNDEAIPLLETVRKDPSLPAVLRSHAAEILADLHLAQGRTDLARRLYTDLLIENPRYPRQSVIRDRLNRLAP